MSDRKRWGICLAGMVAGMVFSHLLTAGADSPQHRDSAGTTALTSNSANAVPVNRIREEAKDPSAIEVQDCVVRFSSEIKVPAMESGRVAEVNVRQNDAVEADAPIARLDDRTLQIRHRASLLQLNAAKSEAADDVELRYTRVALAEAKTELETSQSIQRDARGAIPMVQVQRLRLAVERGELEVARAKKRQKQLGVEVELRDAELSVLDDQLNNLFIKSPIAGVVLAVTKSSGEWIDKGAPIATVARIDRLHVHALVRSQQIAPSVCRGLPVSVQWTSPSDGSQRTLNGTVLSVDPQMMPGGRFRLHAEIINRPDSHDPTQWQLRPGADVRMTVFKSAAITTRPAASTNR